MLAANYIESVQKQFHYYKKLGDQILERLDKEALFHTIGTCDNSIAIIVKHISGNMLSRWTNFYDEDGEKTWRNREEEFIQTFSSKKELLDYWNNGWDCLFTIVDNLKEADLETIIYIRNQGHTVVEALQRQLSHYPYHIGQMVYLGKHFLQESWESLSIAKGASKSYNDEKFSKDKEIKHFTDES